MLYKVYASRAWKPEKFFDSESAEPLRSIYRQLVDCGDLEDEAIVIQQLVPIKVTDGSMNQLTREMLQIIENDLYYLREALKRLSDERELRSWVLASAGYKLVNQEFDNQIVQWGSIRKVLMEYSDVASV